MRTFHIGGAASRAAVASSVEAKSNGTIRFTATMRYVTNGKGAQIVISRSGEVLITDDHGRERERHKVPYGATLIVKDGMVIKAGTALATWDPLTRPIITEYAGQVRFENVEEGVTVARQVDEVTGLSTLVAIDAKRRGSLTKTLRPQVKLINDANEEVKIAGTEHSVAIGFQVGALIMVKDGQQVSVGEVLARIPTESQKRAILPVVCHALRNCSKRARRKMPVCWRKSRVRLRSVKKPRASSVWKSRTWTATSMSS